jgi:hypothetical protein
MFCADFLDVAFWLIGFSVDWIFLTPPPFPTLIFLSFGWYVRWKVTQVLVQFLFQGS